jgi:hypothetical protein
LSNDAKLEVGKKNPAIRRIVRKEIEVRLSTKGQILNHNKSSFSKTSNIIFLFAGCYLKKLKQIAFCIDDIATFNEIDYHEDLSFQFYAKHIYQLLFR